MMKNLTSFGLALLSSNLLVGCVMGDNDAPPIPFPRSCAEVAASKPAATDGDQTLFVDHDQTKPWVAYCVDMASDTPAEYLSLDPSGAGTWSKLVAGGSIAGTDVETRFDKIRIDPVTLKVDTSDLTFAVSSGSATLSTGAQVQSMPLGVGMTCGGGYSTAQIDIEGTPFTLPTDFSVAGDAGAKGHADLWSTNQTVEMWSDGDCAWVGPTAMPANPVNSAGGYIIQLTYSR